MDKDEIENILTELSDKLLFSSSTNLRYTKDRVRFLEKLDYFLMTNFSLESSEPAQIIYTASIILSRLYRLPNSRIKKSDKIRLNKVKDFLHSKLLELEKYQKVITFKAIVENNGIIDWVKVNKYSEIKKGDIFTVSDSLIIKIALDDGVDLAPEHGHGVVTCRPITNLVNTLLPEEDWYDYRHHSRRNAGNRKRG